MVRVKICGITNSSDASAAALLGVHALGLVFAESKRQISVDKAREIARAIPPMVTLTGVFVNEEPNQVNDIVEEVGLDAVQLHGEESPEYCGEIKSKVIKAIRVRKGYLEEMAAYRGKVQGFLLDTYVPGAPGGTGRSFDWDLALAAKEFGPIILAGGLTEENVYDALVRVQPYAVDVSSGVETKGIKDPLKIRRFIDQVRRYNYADAAR